MDVAVTTHNLLVCHVREGGNSVHVTVRACRDVCWVVCRRACGRPPNAFPSFTGSIFRLDCAETLH